MALTLTPETESRVLAAATRRNQAPATIIDAALEEYLRNEPAQDEAEQEAAYQEEQTRLRRLLLAATEEAKQVEPMPYVSPSEEATDGEQKRMRDLLASVQAQARLLPPVSPEQRATGAAPEEQAFGEIVAEKYRKQGFNV